MKKKRKSNSRNSRYDEATDGIASARSTMEELRDELQEWLDNMPDNLQGGTKAVELQEAIDSLDQAIGYCEDAEGVVVDFPSMF